MHLALYAGTSLQHAELLSFAAPLIAALAERLTLIAPVSEATTIDDTIAQIQPAPAIQLRRWCQGDNFAAAILTAIANERPDLLLVPAFATHTTPMSWRRRQLEFSLLGSLPIPFLRVYGRVTPIRRIVAASAGGEQSLRCVPLVSQLARACQAEVTVLHVTSQEIVYFDGFTEIPPRDETAATTLQRLVAAINDQGSTARLEVMYGLVEETILAVCHQYDLLVIGSHQAALAPTTPAGSWLGLLQRLSLQDVTHDLLDRSPIPVLVI